MATIKMAGIALFSLLASTACDTCHETYYWIVPFTDPPVWPPTLPDKEDIRTCNQARVGASSSYQAAMQFQDCMRSFGYVRYWNNNCND